MQVQLASPRFSYIFVTMYGRLFPLLFRILQKRNIDGKELQMPAVVSEGLNSYVQSKS